MLKKMKSIRIKLFLTLTITIIVIVLGLIIINNVILERFYIYSKVNTLIEAYNEINKYFDSKNDKQEEIDDKLEKFELNNNFQISIFNEDGVPLYNTNQKFTPNYMGIIFQRELLTGENIIYNSENIKISRSKDIMTGYNYIYLRSTLDNNYELYIRVPIASIQESVEISNRFLQLMGFITVIISGIVVIIISKHFTDPILQLNEIANKMAKLDFSAKYQENNEYNEIDNLGKSINEMSNTMEKTIKQLRNTNIELEKDIEKKSKTDEMRKQFISDVSHELKTPISLIQGYAEGLVENVANDEKSRKFYAEVILDETNKMDTLVKRLLELIKIEYGELEFNNTEFNITELISEIIRKSAVIIENKNVDIIFERDKEYLVNSDEFYIEQVITNYFTNAIKNVIEVNGKKEIRINITQENNSTKILVFNTGKNIKEEDIERIWKRFYKIDESRKREDGGTGIGLSIVKAIAERMKSEYGVINKEDGVEFYFEIKSTI